MHTAARMYYVDGISQVEVARRMQVSTATVSRLLAGARREGIVRFEVPDLDEANEIGGALAGALGLRVVRVLDSSQPAALATQVASLLREAKLDSGSVLAVGWGRTVQSVINAGLPKLPDITVIPTMGGTHQTATHFQINEFVRSAAEQTRGHACFLYAPSIVSPELRHELLGDAAIARVVSLWDRVDAAILGIGDFQHARTMHDVDIAAGASERIAGDVARHYFDEAGTIQTWPGYDNLMAISPDQLRRVPLSIGVALGKDKVRPIIGAARSSMINALVTDIRTAEHLQEARP
ncbi:MAG: sugar-binding domain-containing protein [Paracoccaceae bacterium]|nr:sugar-binding domain-containing protein [Paracoccaceae bacterium]